MADSKVEIKIPEQLITDMVRAEMVSHLGKAPEIIEAVVRSAMCARKDSYSKETVFEAQVAEMLRQEAANCFKEWLAQNKEDVRKAVTRELKRNGIAALVDAVIKASECYSFSARLELKSPPYEP